MLSKPVVYNALREELDLRKSRIEESLSDSLKSMTRETKSSAGDKHETSRAMAQLEQEKLSSQLSNATQLKGIISGINPEEEHTEIQFGSLIQLDQNWYFLSVGMGSMMVGNTKVFCLSAATPLGRVLLKKKLGDEVSFNGKSMKISHLK
jgi:transcription elongation GreA/GreB family factor